FTWWARKRRQEELQNEKSHPRRYLCSWNFRIRGCGSGSDPGSASGTANAEGETGPAHGRRQAGPDGFLGRMAKGQCSCGPGCFVRGEAKGNQCHSAADTARAMG